jgi:hypothetical protein
MGVQDRPSWLGWADQSEYYKMSSAIANGTIYSPNFIYGIGYPILGSPFVLLSHGNVNMLHNIFFVPDLLLVFVIVYVTFNLTYNLTKNLKIAILSLISLFFLTPYLQWFVFPWNIHVLDAGILSIFYVFFRRREDISNKNLIIAGLIGGWIFATRFIDVLWVLPLFIAFLVFNPKKIKYFVPGILIITMILVANYEVLGNPFNFPEGTQKNLMGNDPAEQPLWEKIGMKRIDWSFSTLLERSYCILLDPPHCIPNKTGDPSVDTWWYWALANKFPLLGGTSIFIVFSPLGIYLLFRHFRGQQRAALLMLLVGFVAAYGLYTAGWWFTSGWVSFFRYHIFWLPIFTIFSIYAMSFIYFKIGLKIKRSKE